MTTRGMLVAAGDMVHARACWLVPLLCGLISVLMGQDCNWDLQNYHLYNPYALLTGRVGFDMAPGSWQGYFNPTIDIPYYLMVMHWPAWLVQFVMGAVHGLNFPLLLAIARHVVPAERSTSVPFWLAAAGFAGTGFLSELGNTMGDNLTALFVLGSLLIVLRAPRAGMVALAGVIMGLGTGLKLTNATYALALCAACFVREGTFAQRFRDAFVFGLGVLAGIAISAGHWYWTMWQTFANPLFPQFNDRFLSPLAEPIGIGDTQWLPKSLWERLVWPFVFTLNPRRVCELPLRNLIWPLWYTFGCTLLVALAARRRSFAAQPRQAWLLLAFGALSYLLWMNLFSIYRYLVPLELLAPTMCWLLIRTLLPTHRSFAIGCIALCVGSILSLASWGRAGHGPAFTVEAPQFDKPAQTIIHLTHAPSGWVVPFFQPEIAFVSLGAGFPESPAWLARAKAMRDARTGPFYVMLEGDRADPNHIPSEAELAERSRHLREGFEAVRTKMERYGLEVTESCRPFKAQIGGYRLHYRLCEAKDTSRAAQ